MNLFSRYGIKSVNMNQISTSLQMPKKALYAEFENKEDLLLECLKYEKKCLKKILEKVEREAQNPLEVMIVSWSDIHRYSSKFCPAFYRDIQQYHHAQHVVLSDKDKLLDMYMRFFEQGIQEGYLQPSFKYETIVSLFVEQLSDSDRIQHPHIVLAFLRNVCTDKGLEVLNSFAPVRVDG